ncbi:MAG: hypothetical protein JWM33_2395, partial [Caulobacteraceae bacterium]|nr:hypothetical protein [Caulobacteraceae bacterium]
MSTRAIGDTAAARQAEEVVLINPTTGAQYVAGSAASGAALDATGAEKAPVYL